MKKIIIVGAGISGLYFANLLEINGKYDYKILEKRSSLDLNDGYGVQLSVNAIKLLNKVGFKNLAVHDVYYPSNINFYKANNCKLISKINISQFNQQGNFYTTLKRSVLINFLLKNIPRDKIIFKSRIQSIDHETNLKINTLDKSWDADHLIISDGIFSKSKEMVLKSSNLVRYYNSVALRGTLKNLDINDISLFLGPKFHFVIYPVNQDNEYNFIAIIRDKNANKDDEIYKQNLLESHTENIFSKTSYKLKDKLENISIYPVFVSKNFNIPSNKNIFLTGDALFAFPPSFAQGAAQSIESSYETYENIQGINKNYYENRRIRTKKINSRSEFNHFAFHISNPIFASVRNLSIKYLSNNKSFLNNYLRKIYNNK